jgi:hypothetical protein
MSIDAGAPAEVRALLHDMFAPDGYSAVVHEWPGEDGGHARIEVIAGADACADCLVPKAIMKTVLMNQLPAGVVIDDEDLIYPNDRPDGEA